MLGYFIQTMIWTSEHHVIFAQGKDDYASKNQQDSKANPAQTFSNLRNLEICLPVLL